MFYQPNATASELQTFRNLTAVKKDVRAHWLSILRPYQANDGRHTEIQCQEALIHLRDRILENGAHDESSHPSIIYYHLARHFQTVIGWATMTDAEREALSHAMQSLYNLFDLSLNAAQVLIVEVMKATIKDPNLLSRIMAAQLIMTASDISAREAWVKLILRVPQRMANGMMMACGRNVFISMRDKCRKCRKGDIRLMRCGRSVANLRDYF